MWYEKEMRAACLYYAGAKEGMLCSPDLTRLVLLLARAARAMLMKADILLLDEPTNHLDVANVAWLEQYLVSRPDVSSMIVSHDSGARRLFSQGHS